MARSATADSVGHVYTCAVCGKALGMYEPLVWARGGPVVEGSLITLKEDPAFDPATARLLHAECAGRSPAGR